MTKAQHRVLCNNLILFAILAFSLTTLGLAHPTNTAEKKHIHTLMNLADQELRKMNYPKADSLYTLILHKHPDNPELYWKLARLQISLGESIPYEKTISESNIISKQRSMPAPA